MVDHSPVRWYNPTLQDFEWREVPTSDEQALKAIAGSYHSPDCVNTYREWRQLGASIGAALIRAGETAKERDERE